MEVGRGKLEDVAGAEVEEAAVAVAVVEERREEGGAAAGGDVIGGQGEDEAAFLADARERGEKVVPVVGAAREAVVDEGAALPSLDELVQRIPAEVRATLDDLFRVKFTTVRRVPAKALKG